MPLECEEGSLPQRHGHPLLAYAPAVADLEAPPGFADVYELASGPVCARFLDAANTRGSDATWQV